MNRWLKLILKLLAGSFLLVVILWLCLGLYVSLNKKTLLHEITQQLNEGLNGTLSIESMKPELIRGFPAISVSLSHVLLRDSLYSIHHHNLLEAAEVYISIDAFSVLFKAPRIRNVEINSGKVYVFTDSTGYSNTHIFRRKDTSTTDKAHPKINHIFLHKVDFVYENNYKFKLFHLDIHEMEAVFDYNITGWNVDLNMAAFVKDFSFNTEKGSYMKDKELAMHVKMDYNRAKEILSIPEQPIRTGNDDLTIGGTFFFSQTPASFVLNVTAKDILFKNAKSLLTHVVSEKLSIIDLAKPLSVHANINGRMIFRDTPVVRITWVVKDNTLTTPIGEIKDCSFTGLFFNHIDTAAGHTDGNSKISLYNLKGVYEQIPFSADTLRAINLTRPVIEGKFVSHFPLARLNPIIGGNTFAFNSGNVDLNLLYKGGILPDDTTLSYVYGTVKVSNAAMTYLPRHLSFINTSALVSFEGGDVLIQNARVQSGSSVLTMTGSMRNFLNLYYHDPTKILLDWNIRSSRIDLNEFHTFLAARTYGSESEPAKTKTGGVTRISRQLDHVLDASSVHMRLQVDKLLYKDFTADNINADIQLAKSGITLNNVSVNNAGGKLTVHGIIDQRGKTNPFHVVAAINNVHIEEFFHSFANFGQTAITDKTMHGRLYADVDVTGSIRDNGDIVPNSFSGTVKFDVRDGALIDFGPFIKVSKYVFRNRNLSNVAFSDLKNTLDIQGDKITINPMLIESSAINLKVKGVYSFSKGTDIDIDVPLRNPKKDELIIEEGAKQDRDMKGIIVHLKAVDGDDGGVKIKLMMKKQEDPNDPNAPPGKKNLKKRLLDKIRK